MPPPLRRLLAASGPSLAFALLLVAFAVIIPLNGGDVGRFYSADNVALMLCQAVIVCVAACGITLVMITGGIDLAIGSAIALVGVVAAQVLADGQPLWLALLAGVGAGCVGGAVSGVLIAGCGMQPFIVTLAMMGALRGAAKLCTDDSASMVMIDAHPSCEAFQGVMQPSLDPALLGHWWSPFAIQAPGLWIALGLVALTWVVLNRTVFGRRLFLIGSNPAAARLTGVPVGRTLVLAYIAAGVCVGIAGCLELSRLGLGDPTTAQGRELDVIAAAVIGGTSLSGGRGSVVGAAVGALMMVVLRNGITSLGVPQPWQDVAIGAVIVGAALVDRLRTR